MSQNCTLIGCLAKTGQDQQLKLRPQSHILFSEVIWHFWQETVSPSREIFMAGTF